MRIGLMVYGRLDQTSGGYLYDRQLCSAWRHTGHHIEIVSLPPAGYAATLLTNWDRRWRDHLLGLKVDVLIQDELCHPSLFRLNSTIRSRVHFPLICLVHHLRSSEFHPAPQRWLYRWVERRYLSTVDGFIFNSHPTMASVEKLLGRAAPGVVATPGRDHLKAAPDQARFTQPPGERPLQILFVGNLIRRKGLHWLLQALAGLATEDWQLQVVGRPDLEPEYSRRVLLQMQGPEFEGRATYLGEVQGEELSRLYQQSDLLAVPSNYEGFGLVYLEAMGYGLPVLASAAGGASDLIRHGQDGFLIAPGDVAGLRDRLLFYLQEPRALVDQGRAASRRYQEQPTWADSAAQVAEYLERQLQ
jgi:glycosyltransferase involved in cell wall biosynthesis